MTPLYSEKTTLGREKSPCLAVIAKHLGTINHQQRAKTQNNQNARKKAPQIGTEALVPLRRSLSMHSPSVVSRHLHDSLAALRYGDLHRLARFFVLDTTRPWS